MNLLFFLGSGISLESGLPNTKRLTEYLFSKNFQLIGSGRYIESTSDCPKVKEIKSFLTQLKNEYEKYVMKYTSVKEYSMSYEDLYYVLEQLKSIDESYFKDYSIAYYKKWFQEKYSFEYKKFIPLIKNSAEYISDVIRTLLVHKQTKGLNLLSDLKEEVIFEKIDVFTLNHDLLIESILGNELVDGFKLNGELRYFDPIEYKRTDKKYFLYKLHGSINWFYWSKINPDGLRNPTRLGMKVGGNKWTDDELKDSEGYTWRKEEDIPIFLTGSNKTFRYYYQDYFELHYKFLECLKNNRLLVISGYGGSDNLINFRIKDWLENDGKNLCVFLHEKEKIPDYFLSVKSRCEVFPKWFKDTSIQDIKGFLV